jgi:hypothetical protein
VCKKGHIHSFLVLSSAEFSTAIPLFSFLINEQINICLHVVRLHACVARVNQLFYAMHFISHLIDIEEERERRKKENSYIVMCQYSLFAS